MSSITPLLRPAAIKRPTPFSSSEEKQNYGERMLQAALMSRAEEEAVDPYGTYLRNKTIIQAAQTSPIAEDSLDDFIQVCQQEKEKIDQMIVSLSAYKYDIVLAKGAQTYYPEWIGSTLCKELFPLAKVLSGPLATLLVATIVIAAIASFSFPPVLIAFAVVLCVCLILSLAICIGKKQLFSQGDFLKANQEKINDHVELLDARRDNVDAKLDLLYRIRNQIWIKEQIARFQIHNAPVPPRCFSQFI